MSKLYIMNSPILTTYGLWRFEGPLTEEAARDLLAGGFVSALGHEGAAHFLSARLGVELPYHRIQVTLEPGERALILQQFSVNTVMAGFEPDKKVGPDGKAFVGQPFINGAVQRECGMECGQCALGFGFKVGFQSRQLQRTPQSPDGIVFRVALQLAQIFAHCRLAQAHPQFKQMPRRLEGLRLQVLVDLPKL